MSLFSQSSEPQHTAGRQSRSLTRHIFVRVAFPVGILFLSCFSLLDRLVQDQLRDRIKQELVVWDTQTDRANANGEARLSKSLGSLADALGMPRAVQSMGHGEGLFAGLIQRLALSLDEDVYAIAGPDKKSIVTMRREGNELKRVLQEAAVPDTRQLTELDGQYYFLTGYPLLKDGNTVGWVAAGRRWTREMALAKGSYVLAKQGRVVAVSGSEAGARLAPGTQLPACKGESGVCELEIQDSPHLLVRAAASGPDQEIEVYMVRSLDALAGPLLGMTRRFMLLGAILTILGALGMALLIGRAITRPLRNIIEFCAVAQVPGHLSEVEIPRSQIAEMNALGQKLQSAVRSVEDGQTKLTQAYFQFMGAMVALLDARDPYTSGHSHRVSAYSEALARDFGLPQHQIDDIRVGALLHDIGKVGVPDEVLRKYERLTKEEFDLMKQHPTIGRKVLEQVAQFAKYLDAVELHHENLDGTGYPRGLRGDQIPMSARIVKVADVYDALSTDRPYRKRMRPDEVVKILRDGAGTQFDRQLVEVFLTRSVPSFEQRSGLEQLQRAIGTNHVPAADKKAVGA